MRVDPKKETNVDKVGKEEKIQKTARKVAIVMSFVIVYFFLIKLLFL